MKKQRILLLMIHWIGDTFWAVQVIPELKKRFPDAEFYAGVKKWAEDLLPNLIDDDKIIILKNVISDRRRESFSLSGYFREVRGIRRISFDMVIDLSLNRYSALFAFFSGAKKRVGLSQHSLSFLYTDRGNKFADNCHLYLRPWEAVKTIFPDIVAPSELFPPVSLVNINELNLELTSRIALLVPGAGWKEKEWGIDNFAEIGKFLLDKGYSIIIAGSSKERELCADLKIKLNDRAVIFIKPLSAFIALLRYVSIAVSNDSGTAHLAAASGVKLITVFKVNNHNQYYPVGKNVTIVTKDKAEPENIKRLISEIEGV